MADDNTESRSKADLVKSLRNEYGCGILDAKKALEGADWNYERALQQLRTQPYREAIVLHSSAARSLLDLATEIGKLVEEKNRAYGDSFAKTGDFLRLLYPNGIPPEKYGDALCIVRIFDKLKRIATDKGALGESPYRDIAGYALLGLRMTEHDGLARFQTAHTMTPQEYVALRIPRTHSAPPPDATTLTAGDGGIDKGV